MDVICKAKEDTMLNISRGLKACVTVGLLSVMVAGCESARVTGSINPSDYQQRHPIVVSEKMATLDLLPGAGEGGLNGRQRRDIEAFAREWRQDGRGMVIVQVPQGGSTDASSSQSVRAIRSALIENGIPVRAITHGAYQAYGPSHLAPVRVAYPTLKAHTASKCGQWPTDLGYGSDVIGSMSNKPYYNFGCATQHNLAAQVADPEDFIRPQGEEPTYAPRKAVVLENYRQSGVGGVGAQSSSSSTTGGN